MERKEGYELAAKVSDLERNIEMDRERAGFNRSIRQGLLDMAAEHAQRAKDYLQMAREYTRQMADCAIDVLIVEDNEAASTLERQMLEKEGIRCCAVATGQAALEFCARQKPLVILMDIELTDADGLVLTKTLREREDMKYVPIIAVTGRVDSETMRRAMEAGCDNFIGKPFTKEYFLKIVQQYLQGVGT